MNGYEQMREACQKMRDLLMLRGDGKVRCVLTWDEFNESQKMLRAALALPRRQCDVGTAYEQGNRMRQFCAKQKRNGIINCGYCPIKHQYQLDCTLAWAQMPYAAEEGGAK